MFVSLFAGKIEWPELVGVKGAVAKAIIERESPHVTVLYIWCGWKRIMDCCCNRVWLFLDGEGEVPYEEGKVCMVPRVG